MLDRLFNKALSLSINGEEISFAARIAHDNAGSVSHVAAACEELTRGSLDCVLLALPFGTFGALAAVWLRGLNLTSDASSVGSGAVSSRGCVLTSTTQNVRLESGTRFLLKTKQHE